jgi:hypothetical protein
VESAKGGHNRVKKPHESTKSGKPTYTVSTDKHQGPKKCPSTRRRQRKKSSGDKSKKRPTTATFFFTQALNSTDQLDRDHDAAVELSSLEPGRGQRSARGRGSETTAGGRQPEDGGRRAAIGGRHSRVNSRDHSRRSSQNRSETGGRTAAADDVNDGSHARGRQGQKRIWRAGLRAARNRMTGSRTADTHEQNPAKFGLARANPAKSSKEPARSGLAGPIPGVRRPIRATG